MSSRAPISFTSACPRPIQEAFYNSRGVSRARAALKSNYGLPHLTMGAADTAGAAHALALAPWVHDPPAHYANNSFPYDRGAPSRLELTALALSGHAGDTAVLPSLPVPARSAASTSRPAVCALIVRHQELFHNTTRLALSSASFDNTLDSITRAEQAPPPPLPAEAPPPLPPPPPPPPFDATVDPSAQRGPAAPAMLPHYQSVDTATIPLDFGQEVPVPLGFPAHFQVTGQSGQTELHEPVLLRFINAFPPGTRLTPLDDERSLPRLLAISGWLKPLLPTDHPDLIAPDRKAYPVSINKSSKVGTKGLLVLGDSSATFEESGGLLASMSSPAAALQLLLMHHINVRFTVHGTKLMPAAALNAINFPGKNNKRKSIALRAKRAQGSVYISLIVGSYFGSRMKSFNAKLSNREERQAFVKSKIPILFPPSTEPPTVAPPQPQGVPSLQLAFLLALPLQLATPLHKPLLLPLPPLRGELDSVLLKGTTTLLPAMHKCPPTLRQRQLQQA